MSGAAGGSEETSSGALPLGLWKDSDLLDESFCPSLCFGGYLPSVPPPPHLGDWWIGPLLERGPHKKDNEKLTHCREKELLLAATEESPCPVMKTQCSQKEITALPSLWAFSSRTRD